MKLSDRITAELKGLENIRGYICTNVVNYQQAVPAANEGIDPENAANFQAKQCSTIVKAVTDSLANLQGGKPHELLVQGDNMTMVMQIVNATYFCGVGLTPDGDIESARTELKRIGILFLAEIDDVKGISR